MNLSIPNINEVQSSIGHYCSHTKSRYSDKDSRIILLASIVFFSLVFLGLRRVIKAVPLKNNQPINQYAVLYKPGVKAGLDKLLGRPVDHLPESGFVYNSNKQKELKDNPQKLADLPTISLTKKDDWCTKNEPVILIVTKDRENHFGLIELNLTIRRYGVSWKNSEENFGEVILDDGQRANDRGVGDLVDLLEGKEIMLSGREITLSTQTSMTSWCRFWPFS